jgi:iron complex transport system permease protein
MSVTAASRDLGTIGIAGRIRGRPWLVAGVALVLLAVSVMAGVGLGSVGIGPLDTIGVILWRTAGIDLGHTWTAQTETILWELRLPRVLTAMVVGCGLAVAGATLQGLVRNPLADPYILGTASGAALGAAAAVLITIFIPLPFIVRQFGLLHGLAFIGALGTAFVVLRLGGHGGAGGMTRLLLTGYAVSSILAAFLALAMYLSGSSLREIFSYLLGGLGGSSWARLAIAAPLILGACLGIGYRARSLDGFLLGERAAVHLGVDVTRERRILLALASMATAAAVAISGLIGFVGLVVPHVVRLLVGPGAGRLLPISAIVGASLLSGADLAARLLGDIPVGVVMALLGAPFFLYLLHRSRSSYEL